MKMVKSKYGNHKEMVVLLEFDELVTDVTVDGVPMAGEVVALGQALGEIPVFLLLDEHDNVVFEITLGVITKYEKRVDRVKDDLGDEGTITNYTIEYYSPEDNFENCHFLTMYDADPCWD